MKIEAWAIAIVLAAGLPAGAAEPPKAALDSAAIEELTGAKGKLDEGEGVFKVSMPRTDLAVTVAGARLTPPMGLTCWAAFQRAGDQTMVMGDLVLREGQVNPVMSAALDNGLEVTALHNHFLWESPRVMFMHIGGMGDERKLATAVGAVFAKIKTTVGADTAPPATDVDPARSSLDPRKLDAVLGKTGDFTAGVYKVTFGRAAKMHGASIGGTMGVNTWAAFAGSDEKAIVDGDFAMLETELQGVLEALRAADIQIVAIHQHMVEESPRFVFLHFWGSGPAENLAKGIHSALATQHP